MDVQCTFVNGLIFCELCTYGVLGYLNMALNDKLNGEWFMLLPKRVTGVIKLVGTFLDDELFRDKNNKMNKTFFL